jgi:hypothetical protein
MRIIGFGQLRRVRTSTCRQAGNGRRVPLHRKMLKNVLEGHRQGTHSSVPHEATFSFNGFNSLVFGSVPGTLKSVP